MRASIFRKVLRHFEEFSTGRMKTEMDGLILQFLF